MNIPYIDMIIFVQVSLKGQKRFISELQKTKELSQGLFIYSICTPFCSATRSTGPDKRKLSFV